MKHRGWEKLPGPFSRETTRLQFTMIRFNEEEPALREIRDVESMERRAHPY